MISDKGLVVDHSENQSKYAKNVNLEMCSEEFFHV